MQCRLAVFERSERLARVGHFELDKQNHRLLYCSPGSAALLDVNNKDLLAEDGWDRLLQRIHVEDRAAVKACLLDSADNADANTEFRLSDNDSQWLQLMIQASDRPEISVGVLRQSGGNEHSGRAAYHREAALQTENIADIGYFIFDEINDSYLYASPGCARIYGLSEQEYQAAISSHEEDIDDVFEDDRERIDQIYREYYQQGGECRAEFRIHRADGELRWIRELLVPIEMQADGRVAISRGVLQDITDQKKVELDLREAKLNLERLVAKRTDELASTVTQLQEEIEEREKISAELEFLANHDPLTGLPSLRLCMDRLERALAEARRNQQVVAVMFVDLDGFKEINDNHGHEVGDKVLKVTADRLRAEVRETDTVARIGGDEFLVILSGIPNLEILQRIANSLIAQVSQPICVGSRETSLSASIGIALYPEDATDGDHLIRCADQAMYRIKHAGKNSFGFLRTQSLN